MMRCEPLLRSKKPEQLGMTLPEMIVAMAMLVVFIGVVVLVMQFTLRFFTDSESGEQNEFEVSNGVLIDHLEIQMAMDRLVEVLSQPGVAVENIALTLNDPALDLAQDCASNPVSSWGLPKCNLSVAKKILKKKAANNRHHSVSKISQNPFQNAELQDGIQCRSIQSILGEIAILYKALT